jgi:hypothetical protein
MDALHIVTTQTSLSEDEAKILLEKHNNDYMKVIRQHFCIQEKAPEKRETLNQEIYSQIRKKIHITNENPKV